MPIPRPAALRDRQLTGRAFAVPFVLIRVDGSFDTDGRWVPTETRADITGATYPPDRRDARVREITEGGIQLDALRRFLTLEKVRPAGNDKTPGDIIEYGGERWRVRMTAPWGRFFDTIAVRQEDQPAG